MEQQLIVLLTTAAGLGFLHTVLGPDHYVPFIAISKARQWTLKKTAWITGVCGLAHVGSSVVIGIFGIGLSIKLAQLEAFEALRGTITGWLIIAFGLAYLVWGIRKAVTYHQRKRVMESLEKESGASSKKSYKQLIPWMLFVVFIFGPCEPLIPVLMFPAADVSIAGMIMVAAVFGLVTIGTMLLLVLVPQYGIQKLRFSGLKQYGHAVAGALILFCGVGIQFLGL
ncbi:MAG: sulfite exporter TauE/SafE family protein [Bacteroidales bacterium]|nr:sulfite exporter TauE/SafE family protein [Bacteroidales bacterium]MCF8336366.1 sulfite exporter TauE/SafE family protein [Bacteroidales bacterium]